MPIFAPASTSDRARRAPRHLGAGDHPARARGQTPPAEVERPGEVARRGAEVVPGARGGERGEALARLEQRLVETRDQLSRSVRDRRQESRLDDLRSGEDAMLGRPDPGEVLATESDDLAALDRHAATEGPRVGGALHEQGRGRAPAAAPGGEVGAHQVDERPGAERVAVDHQREVGASEEFAQRCERAARALQLGLVGIGDRHAAEGIAEPGADRAAQVMEVDRDRPAARVGERREASLGDRAAGDRQQGLGDFERQRAQALAPPGGEQKRPQSHVGKIMSRGASGWSRRYSW